VIIHQSLSAHKPPQIGVLGLKKSSFSWNCKNSFTSPQCSFFAFGVMPSSKLVILSAKCCHLLFKIRFCTLSWICNMNSTQFLFMSLGLHASFMTSFQVKTNFQPSNIFFWNTHVYKKVIVLFLLNFNDTLFPLMLRSLKLSHFSLLLCHLMRTLLQMFEISHLLSRHPLSTIPHTSLHVY